MTETDRRTLTFRQAEGLEPLPAPLELGHLSQEARVLIWSAIYASLVSDSIKDYSKRPYRLGIVWSNVMVTWWVRRQHRPIDEFDPSYLPNHDFIKSACLFWEISLLFDFLTFVLRQTQLTRGLIDHLSQSFQDGRVAYRIDDKTIWPAASPEEGETIHRALVDLSASEYGGARSHLKQAGLLLTQGDWAGSIRESIHAVEGVATLIEPSSNTLSDALKKLKNADRMNINLKAGLERLYAYTSDEKGIRHAKAFEETSVDQADAVYMLGACAAFVSFLIARRAS